MAAYFQGPSFAAIGTSHVEVHGLKISATFQKRLHHWKSSVSHSLKSFRMQIATATPLKNGSAHSFAFKIYEDYGAQTQNYWKSYSYDVKSFEALTKTPKQPTLYPFTFKLSGKPTVRCSMD